MCLAPRVFAPQFEDKVVRFCPIKPLIKAVLEPEGADDHTIYPERYCLNIFTRRVQALSYDVLGWIRVRVRSSSAVCD